MQRSLIVVALALAVLAVSCSAAADKKPAAADTVAPVKDDASGSP